jgi:membrane protease YdiL (CAAX protease family)
MLFPQVQSRAYIVALLMLPVLPHFFNDIYVVLVSDPAGSEYSVHAKDAFWAGDFLGYFLLPLLILYGYCRLGLLQWSDIHFHWTRVRANLFLAVVLAAALWMIFYLKAVFLHDWLETIKSSENIISNFFYRPEDGMFRYVLVGVYIAVSAGVVEEVLYRSFLIQGFERVGLPTWVAVAGSVALFVLIHWSSGAVLMFNALVAGIIISAIYIKTRNIMPLVLAHFLIDLSFATGFDQFLFDLLAAV